MTTVSAQQERKTGEDLGPRYWIKGFNERGEVHLLAREEEISKAIDDAALMSEQPLIVRASVYSRRREFLMTTYVGGRLVQ